MKVAVDLDGVVARWNERFIGFTNTLYDRNNKVKDITIWEFWRLEKIKLTEEEFMNGLKLFCEYRMWQNIKPYEFASDGLCAIDSDGIEIYYLTSRPKGSERATAKFLLKHGIPFGNGLIFCKSHEKANIAKQLGVFIAIDDKIETLQDYENKGIIAVSLWQPYNAGYWGHSVENIKEFYHFLKDYS